MAHLALTTLLTLSLLKHSVKFLLCCFFLFLFYVYKLMNLYCSIVILKQKFSIIDHIIGNTYYILQNCGPVENFFIFFHYWPYYKHLVIMLTLVRGLLVRPLASPVRIIFIWYRLRVNLFYRFTNAVPMWWLLWWIIH
jgi:hypothetical protein